MKTIKLIVLFFLLCSFQYISSQDKTATEQMPMYPGGEQALIDFISKNIKYPEDAEKMGIVGKVVIRFVVNEMGVVDSVKVVNSLYPSCDNEAVRLVKSLAKFTPGKINGKNVSVFYTLPINFNLDADPFVSSGMAKFKKKDYNGAIEDFTKALKTDSKNTMVYYNRAIVKSYLNDYNGAISDLTKAIEINPLFSEANYTRATFKYQLKDYDGAIVDLTKTNEIKPGNPDAYYYCALAKNNIKDFNGAISDFTKAIEYNYNYVTIYKDLYSTSKIDSQIKVSESILLDADNKIKAVLAEKNNQNAKVTIPTNWQEMNETDVQILMNNVRTLAVPLSLKEITEFNNSTKGVNAMNSMPRPGSTLCTYINGDGKKVNVMTTSGPGSFATFSNTGADGMPPKELDPQLLFSLYKPIVDVRNEIGFTEIAIYETNAKIKEHYYYYDGKWYKIP